MTPDSEGLHAIANTEKPDRQADIIFIHGLGGASHSTWRHGKVGKPGHFFWPEELAIDLPDCGIWSVGYPTDFTELNKPGMIIDKRAGNISHKLANAGLGHCPLFFVTHSMGGLIVKSLIVGSQTLPDENRKRIVSIVRGLVFCGAPHRGSAFADAAVVLGKYFGGSQVNVEELRKNAELLDIRHDEFIEWHRKNLVPVDSYAENIQLFHKSWLLRWLPLGLVVPRASANPNIAGHTVHDVDEDHLTLVKPPNRQHDVYAGVLCFVRDVLKHMPANDILKLIPVDANLSIVTIVFRSEEPADKFDPVKFATEFQEVLGIKASRIRIVSVRTGSTVVTIETDPVTRHEIITALSLYQEAHRGFAKLTGITKMSWVEGETRRSLDLSQSFVSPERRSTDQATRDEWFLAHPYPMPPNFTGRLAERDMLTHWLDEDTAYPLLVLRALGGFGKSALVWHWLLHDVKPAAWPRVVWWSFYEGDASFDHFLADTLEYLGVQKTVCQALSPHERVEKLLQLLHTPGTLLILDGFERLLRVFGGLNAAYKDDDLSKSEVNDCDCISPFAERFLRGVATLPDIRAKVLLTTRLLPRVLEAKGGGFLQGCREEELLQMQPADTVEFFRAQGIRGTHTEIETACQPYGYHPLTLCLLAGLIVGDLQQPGDIAAAKRLDVSGDLIHNQHHVLETAYNSLTPEGQNLLSRIACFRSPVKYEALKALAETPHPALSPMGEGAQRAGEGEELDTDLRDLVARGLLHHDTKEGRFDLHPIVRRYAYDRLAVPDRTATHTRLRDYFAAVPPVDKVTCLDELAPVIELYHHTVRAGQFDEARTLYRDRLTNPIFFQLGAYQLSIDLLRALFPDGEDRLPRLKDERAQAWTLNELGNAYGHSGQPRLAMPLYEAAINIHEKKTEYIRYLAISLGNIAQGAQVSIGALRAAEANLRRSITLCRQIKEGYWEAVGHQQLGLLLAYRGAYAESETELLTSTDYLTIAEDAQGQCLDEANRTLRVLLRLREAQVLQSAVGARQSAIPSARRALELADEKARAGTPYVHDFVYAHWLLGAALRVAGQTNEAESHLYEALERCRRINSVYHEADILIDLARLRAATASARSGRAGAPEEARRLAEEALVITERSGYVLQGADAHLELAKLALAKGDKTTALDHAQQAKDLATCDGPPDYTYKAAYDEATALLAKLES